MAVRKTYRSIVYKDLDTYIVIDGKKTLVQFRGGSVQPPINGIFVTDDPKVIEAMDKDRGLNTSFRCIRVEGEAIESDNEVLDETPVSDQKEKMQVTGIATIQQAKEYLLKHVEGLVPAKMPNAKSVLNLAAKNNIEFPDLKL